MTNEDMFIVKHELLEISQLYVKKINTTNDEKVKSNLFGFVLKINNGLQLIDVMEKHILSERMNSSDYKIIALKQASKIDTLENSIKNLVNRLEKYEAI